MSFLHSYNQISLGCSDQTWSYCVLIGHIVFLVYYLCFKNNTIDR